MDLERVHGLDKIQASLQGHCQLATEASIAIPTEKSAD
jgi:hypothetical protein